MSAPTVCPTGCTCRGQSRSFRLYLGRELLADNVPADLVSVTPKGQPCQVTFRDKTYGVNGVDRVDSLTMAVYLFGPLT